MPVAPLTGPVSFDDLRKILYSASYWKKYDEAPERIKNSSYQYSVKRLSSKLSYSDGDRLEYDRNSWYGTAIIGHVYNNTTDIRFSDLRRIHTQSVTIISEHVKLHGGAVTSGTVKVILDTSRFRKRDNKCIVKLTIKGRAYKWKAYPPILTQPPSWNSQFTKEDIVDTETIEFNPNNTKFITATFGRTNTKSNAKSLPSARYDLTIEDVVAGNSGYHTTRVYNVASISNLNRFYQPPPYAPGIWKQNDIGVYTNPWWISGYTQDFTIKDPTAALD